MAVNLLAPIQRAIQYFRPSNLAVKPADPQEGSAVRLFGGNNTFAGVRIDHETAMRVAVVWACIDVIASALSSSDWNVYEGRRGDDTKKARVDDALQYVLNCRFNDEMTAQSGKRAVMIAAVGFGNGYAEVARDLSGRITGLWPIEPNRVEPRRNFATGALFYRCYQDYEGGYVDLAPSQVLHIRGAGLTGIAGDNVLNRAVQSIAQAVAMDQFASGFFGNNAQLGTVFMYKGGKLDDAHYDRLRQQLEEKHKGSRKAFRSAILDGGDWGVQTIGSDIQGSQLVEAKHLSIEEICRWFRVPPHKVAHLLRATNNNIEHQGLEFSRDTLRPWVKEIEQECDYKLFPMRGTPRFVELDVDWAEQGDYKSRAEAYAALRNIGVFSANDILKKLGENTIGAEGDIRVVQGANVKLEDVGAAYAQPAAPAPEPEEDDERPEPDREMAQAWLASAYGRIAAMVENRRAQHHGSDAKRKAEMDGFAYVDTALKDLTPVFEAMWPGCRQALEFRAVKVVRGMPAHEAAADCMSVLTNSFASELGSVKAMLAEIKGALPKEHRIEVRNEIRQADVRVEGTTVNVPERAVSVNVEAPSLTMPENRVEVNVAPHNVTVHTPEQAAPVVNLNPVINTPEAKVEVNVAAPEVTVEQAAVNVTVEAAQINIPEQPAPVVNIAAPELTVNFPEQPAPVVNVSPLVRVDAPNVTIENKMPAPEVTVNLPNRRVETEIERDFNGKIIRSTSRETDE